MQEMKDYKKIVAVEVDIAGVRFHGKVIVKPAFDPDNQRIGTTSGQKT